MAGAHSESWFWEVIFADLPSIKNVCMLYQTPSFGNKIVERIHCQMDWLCASLVRIYVRSFMEKIPRAHSESWCWEVTSSDRSSSQNVCMLYQIPSLPGNEIVERIHCQMDWL